MLRSSQFDLALIDACLPGLSGLQLAEIAANENTPVLLISGHPDINATLASCGFPHLPKPFSLDALLQRSKEAIVLAEENVRLVKASAGRLQSSIEAAKITLQKSSDLVNRTDGQ